MWQRHGVTWLMSVALPACGAGTALSQDYPHKPVRVLTAEAGGGVDSAARLMAQALQHELGQSVIVDNRNAVVAAETAVKATPDGHTLLVSGGSLWLLPFLRKNVSWDPVKDFSPITLLATSPNMIVVHPSVAAKSVQDLIALAKAKPGGLNYGASVGGSTHLAAELFKSMANVDIARIPYKGNGPALNALIGGEVQLMFATVAAALPHVRSGRLRALASTSARPSALVPDLATVASTLPGYESATLIGVFAPSRTPAAIISVLNREILKVLNTPELRKRFFDSGAETPGGSPAEFLATIKADMARMGKVIRDAGIRGE